jgi:hypothetical protein
MFFQVSQKSERFVTDITFKLMPFTMHTLNVLLHGVLRRKHSFTHITAIWTALTVYALIKMHVKMFLQVTLITVGLITQTARERTLSSMQALMFLQITLIIK